MPSATFNSGSGNFDATGLNVTLLEGYGPGGGGGGGVGSGGGGGGGGYVAKIVSITSGLIAWAVGNAGDAGTNDSFSPTDGVSGTNTTITDVGAGVGIIAGGGGGGSSTTGGGASGSGGAASGGTANTTGSTGQASGFGGAGGANIPGSGNGGGTGGINGSRAPLPGGLGQVTITWSIPFIAQNPLLVTKISNVRSNSF